MSDIDEMDYTANEPVETKCRTCEKITLTPMVLNSGDFSPCLHCGLDVHTGESLASWIENQSIPQRKSSTLQVKGIDPHKVFSFASPFKAFAEEFSENLNQLFNTTDSRGKKFDQGKTQYHLTPPYAFEQVNRVLMHGAEKYGSNNWQHVEGWKHRYYNAALRHLFQWQAGEQTDNDTGITHLAHAICSLMFLIEKENKAVKSPE